MVYIFHGNVEHGLRNNDTQSPKEIDLFLPFIQPFINY
jgi:hypothetical protein